jgi:hypothetical protein
MRFRVLVIIFNAVVVLSFGLIFLMPMFVLGWEYAQSFWSSNWPFGGAFVVVLLGLNGYFIYNWRVFSLLEREDWTELQQLLEGEVFERKQFGRQRVKILINTYVLNNAIQNIRQLEAFLRTARPNLVPRFSLELGIPYLLSQDQAAMERYYGELKDAPRCSEPVWVRWNYAFALLLPGEEGIDQAKISQAQGVLRAILAESKDPLQKVLSAYLLKSQSADDSALSAEIEQERNKIARSVTPEGFDRYVEKRRENIQVLMLSRLIEDTKEWLYSGSDK